MTSGAWVALAVFAVAAAADWVSRATSDRRLEYAAKPAATAALLALAALLDARDGAEQAWFVAALACSLAGDVLLMLPRDRFLAGLAAFLAAHLCYIAGLWVDGPTATAAAVGAAFTAAALVPLGLRILAAVRASGQPALAPPVGAYIVVIGAMVVSALASGRALAGAGAVLFAGSDAMIAWNRFVRPFAGAAVAIMVTYHLGQLGLVLSLG
jgi:uncharacterized membrane protein YhhN